MKTKQPKPNSGAEPKNRTNSNRCAYLAEKCQQDRILLRLEKGDANLVSEAARAAGLSRSAFLRMYLAPCLSAVGHRHAKLDQARQDRRQSFATFLGAAIDETLSRPQDAPQPSPAAANEFDALFGKT